MFWSPFVAIFRLLEIIIVKWHEHTLLYIPSKWWTVEFQFSCETKDCGKLFLCHMLVHVPTAKCQESSAAQEMPHQCSISWKMASLPSDWTRKRCAVVSSTCEHKTKNMCTSTDRLCLCMVQVWYPFNRFGNGFVALQMVSQCMNKNSSGWPSTSDTIMSDST